MNKKYIDIEKTELNEVYIINSQTFNDNRGFFKEIFRKNELEERIGYPINLEQISHARSKKNVLRGIHIAPWSKLIYCVRGTIQSLVIDFKEGSPTFGRYISKIIGDDNRVRIFVPPYHGNSYLVLSEEADLIYCTDKNWEPGREIGVLWKDPSLNIGWHLDGEPTLSENDKNNPLLEDVLLKIMMRAI